MNLKWTEEYRCGCVSESVDRKKDLLGYCGKHGDSRRSVYREGPDVMIHVERKEPE